MVIFQVLMSAAWAHAAESYFFDRDRKMPATMKIYQKVNVGNCNKKCEAMAAVDAAAQKKVTQPPGRAVNPAHLICAELKGSGGIVFKKNGDEVSACTFADQSVLLSWDLLRKIGY